MTEQDKLIISENIAMLKCPVCGDRMSVQGNKSIVCLNNHCFDIAKRGYVNLLQNHGNSKYDKKLFQSRNIISQTGFFDPLIEAVVQMMGKIISDNGSISDNRSISALDLKTKSIKILDAGCGEGFHLARIINGLNDQEHQEYQEYLETAHLLGVGIDISKGGIQIAAKNYQDIFWLVADLAKTPFMDQQFDVILNILSPANYGEFKRIIGDEGILIKVVPDSDYLKELRTAFYQETDKELYSNKMVLDLFSKNFHIIDTQKVNYEFKLSSEELHHLIKMTPLSWGVSEEKMQEVSEKGINMVTGAFTIIAGMPKKLDFKKNR